LGSINEFLNFTTQEPKLQMTMISMSRNLQKHTDSSNRREAWAKIIFQNICAGNLDSDQH